ncbi:glycoside hydrolase family 27 protein [Novipirellula artificiosorum]|uniref:Alpha-galactosidase n=1 Tax=Novipirellula artificiosorum TaxID=2528016 RepID=A0A5C6E3Y6_9BACT|nr:glycoside hydrolase family 27 protein [Novipirellula artificiosorum]TWU42301.1 Alpha-galactosidase A precursor [Novipirellula artificiosorum]
MSATMDRHPAPFRAKRLSQLTIHSEHKILSMKFNSLCMACFVAAITLHGTVSAPAQDHLDWAQTPPMGWNSFDCFGAAVNEDEIRGNAEIMAAHLKDFGWQYVVVDYCWFYPHVAALNNPPQTEDFKPSLPMDTYGRLLPAVDRFPSATGDTGFKALGDHIHSLGLKFGIHVMRGIPREAVARKMPIKGTQYTADQVTDQSTCSWLNTMYGLDMDQPGAQAYYDSLLELYASWGVDYIKVDDIASPYCDKEIEGYRKAIDRCGRQIVLSLSPGNETPTEMAEHVKANANLWRISSDFWDNWESLEAQFEKLHTWENFIGAGHWPDADMIPFGVLNRRGPQDGLERVSRLTAAEQRTLMTLWCIARSPLMYGGDLMRMRPSELKLLTNRDVLAVNQHSTNNRQLYRSSGQVVWVADVPDSNDKYIALFNTRDHGESTVGMRLADIKVKDNATMRDLWNGQEMPLVNALYATIEAHGAGLYRIHPE